MNERIFEFAKNDLINCEYTEFGWQECHYYQFDSDELKKFAELIVRECASLAYDGPGGILEHFGVEE